jgi:hypothetical protein
MFNGHDTEYRTNQSMNADVLFQGRGLIIGHCANAFTAIVNPVA